MPRIPEYRVLVHPSDKAPRRVIKEWERWQAEGCRVFRRGQDDFRDVGYIETLPKGTRVVVGGRESDACVASHLFALSQNSRVASGDVGLVIDRRAISGLRLREVVEYIKKNFNVVVEII